MILEWFKTLLCTCGNIRFIQSELAIIDRPAPSSLLHAWWVDVIWIEVLIHLSPFYSIDKTSFKVKRVRSLVDERRLRKLHCANFVNFPLVQIAFKSNDAYFCSLQQTLCGLCCCLLLIFQFWLEQFAIYEAVFDVWWVQVFLSSASKMESEKEG